MSGVAALDLAAVDFGGADAREWLQGQVTQDLRLLMPDGALRACLCRPTGQLLAQLDVWDLGDRLRVLVHRSELPALLARVEEAVIMEEVEAVRVPARTTHVFGPEVVAAPRPGETWRPRSRTGAPGFDVVAEGPESPAAPLLEPALFDALTLAAGEPIPGIDTNERTLPPELGPAFDEATTSYRKGCYTGQEVLMRLHSRGHTNRTWTGLLAPVLLATGTSIRADGAEVGRVTRAGVHPALGPIAAAFLRREAAGKPLVASTPEGEAAVEARDLPLLSE